MSGMLWLVRDYWQSIAAFGLFGVFHSAAAREPFKNALARRTSPFLIDHFWRLLYCLISFYWYYQIAWTVWGLHPANNAWLIDYPDWVWQTVTAIHLGSIAVVYAAFIQSDYLEFLGLKQAWRGAIAGFGWPEPRSALKQFGTRSLEVHGIYGWVRHPMLVGGLLFYITQGPTLNAFVFALLYSLYMVIGCHYEEQRLVRIFGQDYVAYRNRVGAFLPRLRLARPILESK
jgi:protein-S-isoprenylcysteine O-methyltransferase Ste14